MSFLDSRGWRPSFVCGSLLPSSRTAMSLTPCRLSDSLFLPPFSSSRDLYDIFSSVQFSSVTQSCLTLCNPMNHSTPGLTVHHQCLRSIESVMPSNHLILFCPLLLPPSIFPSIRVFSNESTLHMRRPKYWSFSLSISPSNEYSGLVSFKTDWLYLHALQWTLKSLLQHRSSKASIL